MNNRWIKSTYNLPCLLAHNCKKKCTFTSLPSSKVISLSVENSRFCPVKGVLHEKMDSPGSRTLVLVGSTGWRFFIRCDCSSPTATTPRRSQRSSRSRGAQRILRGGTLVSKDWHRRRRWSDQSPVYDTNHDCIADLAVGADYPADQQPYPADRDHRLPIACHADRIQAGGRLRLSPGPQRRIRKHHDLRDPLPVLRRILQHLAVQYPECPLRIRCQIHHHEQLPAC